MSHAPYGIVRAQVLACTDSMTSEQRDLIDQLPDFLREEGFNPDLFFHEPGGRGIGPLESIVLYLQPHVVSGVVGGAAWAAIAGVTKWARKRIRSTPPDPFFPDGYVTSRMYSGEGRFISEVKITLESVEHVYIHPAIDDDERVRKGSPVKLKPDAHGRIAVATSSGSLRCRITAGRLVCETTAVNWRRREDGAPTRGFACDASGVVEWLDDRIGNFQPVTLTVGSRYRALDWSIVVVEDGLVMVNDMTGHGVCVTTSDVRAF